MTGPTRIAVVAVGGNALTRAGEAGTYREQLANARVFAGAVAGLLEAGFRVVVAHGNGPQVGALAIQQELGAEMVPEQPLWVLGAMTQGQIGHLLTMALREALGPAAEPVGVVTHCRVRPSDAAFSIPTKPIGPFFEAARARELAAARGWRVAPDSGRGHRRVVASPAPVEVLEAAPIRLLVEAGFLVVAAGGGGIPVAGDGGALNGVEAVIDKDLAAQRLAVTLGATVLALTTAVPAVLLDFGTRSQRPVEEMSLAEARAHLAGGEFPAGSMGPKVEAAAGFLEAGGELAIITSPDHLLEALRGRHGTRIRGPR